MSDLTPEALAAWLDDGPVHNWDCDRFQTYDYGLRQGVCDCDADATVRALIAALTEARIEVERLRGRVRNLERQRGEKSARAALDRAAAVIARPYDGTEDEEPSYCQGYNTALNTVRLAIEATP